MSKKGLVYFKEMLAGIIAETDEGYDDDYLENKNARPVSLTLPLSSLTYESKVLFNVNNGFKKYKWYHDLNFIYKAKKIIH